MSEYYSLFDHETVTKIEERGRIMHFCEDCEMKFNVRFEEDAENYWEMAAENNGCDEDE